MRLVPLLFVAALASAGTPPRPATWTGTFTLSAATSPVPLVVRVQGRTATVALGPGHAGPAAVRLDAGRFALRGLPDDVVFAGKLVGTRWSGVVSQGHSRGTFTLHPGTAPAVSALGLYRSAGGSFVAVAHARGLPEWLVELPSGATHGLGASLSTVGPLLGETSGDGTLGLDSGGLVWKSVRYRRVRLRQWEVRVGGVGGTLTVPPGPGPFPAVAMVHGSETSGREEFQVFAAYLESLGVAVLAADKRHDGEPLQALAADAAAQVDFLASNRLVDARRVGLLGDSQAGWTIALAAAADPRVRWAVPLVGPVTTVAETDLFTSLAGAEQTAPQATRAEMLRTVRAAGRGGFDPVPSLRKLRIPVLWVFGDDDRNVPTELCVERLRTLAPGHAFEWRVLPMTHALLDLPNGLYSSLARSRGFAAQLFPTVGAWLRARGILRRG
ncbi:MAG TPA: prolyl oligopeptidase family serine peptidase [Gaiellaceae bacterium]